MKYKGIIFDLDGTAIPNRPEGMPSQRLISVIAKVKDMIPVAVATGRPIAMCRDILKALGLSTPCIISGGTQIIDPCTEEILWEKMLSIEQSEEVMKVARKFDYVVYCSDDRSASQAKTHRVAKKERMIYLWAVAEADVPIILQLLSTITDAKALLVPSWVAGTIDIHVTHKDATKSHSLALWLDHLKLNGKDVVGFGDGNNDLPIFELIGYKVAMQNASEDLKKAADLIAPSVEEDGVAQIIEELFIPSFTEIKV